MRTTLLIALLFCSSVQAFQCPQDHSPEKAFGKAVSVYVIRINSTEFYEDVEDGKFAKLLLTKYSVLETLKGESKSDGELIDMVGIGTGFANLLPGLIYLVAIEERPEGLKKDYINMCDVLGGAFFLEDDQFVKLLSGLRASAKDS